MNSSSPFCTEINRKFIGLVVSQVISCSEHASCVIDGKTIVIVEQASGLISSIQPYSAESFTHSIPLDKIIHFRQGSCLMPGFVDCHVHLAVGLDDFQVNHLKESSADKTLMALKAAQGLMQAGFTTIRTAGDADNYYPTFAVARSITRGDFIGPTIVGAGHYISATGGGGDMNMLSPECCAYCKSDGLIADGVDEMIKAVRQEIKYGSDWIKVLATGAFMSASTHPHDSPENTHFSPEELSAVVQEASRRQVPVMAHAHGAAGIRAAAEAGCRSIEHASFIDADGIAACLANGAWIVPTFAVFAYYAQTGSATGAQDRLIGLVSDSDQRKYGCIQKAVAAGVKVALGSDYVGWSDYSYTAKEFEFLVTNAGMSNMEAIRAGTSSAADLLKIPTIGRIEANYAADLVVVQGNPLEDISVLRSGVCFVMKNGQIVRQD